MIYTYHMSHHTHYKEYIDIRNDGCIIIYKRSDHKTPRFTARLKFPYQTGYVTKSTKTTNKSDAEKFAKDLYYDLEGKLSRGEPIKSYPFSKVFNDWTHHRRLEGQGKKYLEGDIRAAENYILKFFENYSIRKIDYDLITSFFKFRKETGKKTPSLETLKMDARRLKSILLYAYQRGFIQKIPEVPSFKGKKNPRPDFTLPEWRKLYKFMRTHVNEVKSNPVLYRDRYYLQQYILILGNSGIRTGEARRLKWQDIGTTKTIDGDNRTVLRVDGKTGSREVVCNKGAEDYLKRLYDYREKERGDKPPLSEYIFTHPDGKPIKSFKKSFGTLLEKSGLTYNGKGEKRVPYSLRHTYATMRLQEGVSIFQLSANMGTSVEMIETYYGKKRTTTAKAATEITRMSNRQAKTSTSEKPLPWE